MILTKLMILFALLSSPAANHIASAHQEKPRAARPSVSTELHSSVDADGKTLKIHAVPGGPVTGEVAASTEFGTPADLAVIGRKRGWLKVAIPDGSGYLPPDTPTHPDRYLLRADLSAHTLTVFKKGHRLHQFIIGVGAAETPTPTGRFGITDELANTFSPTYGCCVLALTARQHHLAPGWTGGNIVAIHGTDAPETIGANESNGCLHLDESHLRYLMDRVPVGTTVIIHK